MLKGFKDGADGAFLIESVEHSYLSRGWITVVTLNGSDAGKAKQSTKSVNLVIPAPRRRRVTDIKKCHPLGVAQIPTSRLTPQG
ncbi:hypothetical protein [Burkholderia sp. Nafp2/4-1b]|uniref:hypothetical protein n=1 Tax=Burkholderia sp. Nafp2/4-1b TaxID=2116686 RepID=UPI0013CEE4D4|nr:hypothetical protein [Burkholderia sp. Nafp2/4-1b]